MPPPENDRDREPQPTEDDNNGSDEPIPRALLIAGAAFIGGFIGAVAGNMV